jgi:hypothetical protein
MKRIANILLIITAILLGFYYPNHYKFNGIAKSLAIAILFYYILKLSNKLKSKNDNKP